MRRARMAHWWWFSIYEAYVSIKRFDLFSRFIFIMRHTRRRLYFKYINKGAHTVKHISFYRAFTARALQFYHFAISKDTFIILRWYYARTYLLDNAVTRAICWSELFKWCSGEPLYISQHNARYNFSINAGRNLHVKATMMIRSYTQLHWNT